MKQNKLYIILGGIVGFILAIGGVVLAAPPVTYLTNALPDTNDARDLGTTTPAKEWNNLYVKTICLSTTCKSAWPSGGGGGAGNVGTSSVPSISGIPFWTTSGATPELLGSVATTSVTCTGTVTCSQFTVIGSSPFTIIGSGGGGAGTGTVSTSTALVSGQVDFSTSASTIGNDSTFLFDTTSKKLTATYASTTALTATSLCFIGDTCRTTWPTGTLTAVTGTWPIISSGGTTPAISFAWSTTSQPSSSNLFVSNGSSGFYGVATSSETCTSASGISCTAFNIVGTSGALSLSAIPNSSLSNSTISGISLGSNLAAHTTNSTLSGTSYNGSAAVSDWGLNLGNSNIWSVVQQFKLSSSTTLSAGWAKFGETASSTFDRAGVLTLGTPLTVASGGTGAGTLTGCLTGNGTGAITGSGTCNTSNATVSSVGASTPNSTLSIGSTPVTTSGTITFDLNLGHANNWTALQQFQNASTTLLSVGYLSAGKTATTTIDGIGSISMASNSIFTLGTTTAGCLQSASSGIVFVTGTACGSGSGSGGSDPFTHPLYGGVTVSATTTQVSFNATSPYSFTASSTVLLQNATTTTLQTTGTTYLNTTSGNTGIGTTSPYASLSINAPGGEVADFAIGSSTSEVLRVSPNSVAKAGIGTTTPFCTLCVAGDGTNPPFAVSTSTGASGTPNFMIDKFGHVIFSGPKPTCDANCTMKAGTDNAFRITTGSSITSTTVTFANTFPIAPICLANEGSAGTVTADASSTATTVVITIASALTSKDVDVVCFGIQ